MKSKTEIGNALKQLRGKRSLQTAADEIGITKSALAMYERGERIPRDEAKVKIADYYGVSLEELFYYPIEHNECSIIAT